MLKRLRKPWLYVLLMNFLLLQVVDQLNHWTSPGHLHLQVWWLLPIYPALYFSMVRGFLVTFASGLMAEAYCGFPSGVLLFLLLLLHVGLFLFRRNLQTFDRIPPPFLAWVVISLGFLAWLPLTPASILFQPAFWFRFTADLGYNLIVITVISYTFYRVQHYLLGKADVQSSR